MKKAPRPKQRPNAVGGCAEEETPPRTIDFTAAQGLADDGHRLDEALRIAGMGDLGRVPG